MRVTLEIDGELLAYAEMLAKSNGHTLDAVVQEALRRYSAPCQRKDISKPVRLRTVGGRGACPGVDLNSNSALLDRMRE